MPVTMTHTLYHFDELSDRAKETARDWWRQLEQMDFDTDFVIEDAQRMGAILGIELDVKPVKLMGGGTRTDPVVYWSGFSSQGDGAQFEGRYAYAKGAHKAIRKAAPTDERLHAIADGLLQVQKACGYRLVARCDCKGARYSHAGWMRVDVVDRDDSWKAALPDHAETVAGLLRDFANWIYRQLETEYNWRMADEQVDDAITANEYTFDENGRRAD